MADLERIRDEDIIDAYTDTVGGDREILRFAGAIVGWEDFLMHYSRTSVEELTEEDQELYSEIIMWLIEGSDKEESRDFILVERHLSDATEDGGEGDDILFKCSATLEDGQIEISREELKRFHG